MKNILLQKRSTAGFTLLEVLVVIVMIAILMGIAGPGWLGFLNRQRATSAREQVLQSIRLAQAEAIRTKRNQTVTFNLVVNPPTVTSKGVTTQLGDGKLRAGMVSLQSPVTTITFDENGNLDSEASPPMTPPFTIVVRAPANTGKARCLIMQTLLGAVRTADEGQPGCPN